MLSSGLERLKQKPTLFQKPNRPIHTVFIHCSASDNPDHDDIKVIKQWHLERGWSDVGYHYFIKKDGTLQLGRDLEKTPAAQKGYNTGTIAICLHGLEENEFTQPQFYTLIDLCIAIDEAYFEDMCFRGHCEVNSNKTCPVFNYKYLLGLNDKGRMV